MIAAKDGEEERLARTLASLVGGAVEGTVREVIVVLGTDAPGPLKVADHAGCRIVKTLAEAIAVAKGEWLLMLEPGARLLEGWSESVMLHVVEEDRPARLSRDVSARSSLVARLRARTRPFAQGLLISRKDASARYGGKSDGVRSKPRTLRLAARMLPAS
ncbi:MAG: glycosyl transferase family 2 [Methylobacterium mesophilicum]|nr:glycosyl transferase family 2 [Methylobacterium mesophilicum]